MNRRQFLGFIGGVMVLAPLAEWPTFEADVAQDARPSRQPWVFVDSFELAAEEDGVYSLSRVGAKPSDGPLIVYPVQKGGWFCWFAPRRGELAFPDGVASFMVDGPPTSHWAMRWSKDNEWFITDSKYGTRRLSPVLSC